MFIKSRARKLIAVAKEAVPQIAVEADSRELGVVEIGGHINLVGVISVRATPKRGAAPIVDFQDIVVQACNPREVGPHAVLTKIDNRVGLEGERADGSVVISRKSQPSRAVVRAVECDVFPIDRAIGGNQKRTAVDCDAGVCPEGIGVRVFENSPVDRGGSVVGVVGVEQQRTVPAFCEAPAAPRRKYPQPSRPPSLLPNRHRIPGCSPFRFFRCLWNCWKMSLWIPPGPSHRLQALGRGCLVGRPPGNKRN